MATPKPLTDFSPLAAVDVQQDDVLFVVDVHDTSQSSAGSTKTLSLTALFGSMVDALLSGVLTFSAAVSKIIPGATSFSIRDHADSADNLLVTDVGNVTVRAGLTSATAAVTGALTAGTATAGTVTSTADNSGHHFVSTGATPTIAFDTGAGTGAGGSLIGTDTAGVIAMTTGTGTIAFNTVVTVTLATAYPNGFIPMVCYRSGPSGAASFPTLKATAVTTSSFAISAGPAALAASNSYQIYYHVLGT